MKIVRAETYEAMSKQAAEDLFSLLQSLKSPLICAASGASPVGLYNHLVQLVNASEVDTSDWFFVGLDEWKGMNGKDEGSCRHMLDQQLFLPLNVKEQNICFFDGRVSNLEEECEKIETFIRQHGDIDVAVLGIGLNGHIGMNEPGTPANFRSHVAAIHISTQQVGQKYFSEAKQLDTGVTLGLATLLEAGHLLLLANGTHKAEIIKRTFTEDINGQLPASLLRGHPNFWVYLDEEAAALLPHMQ